MSDAMDAQEPNDIRRWRRDMRASLIERRMHSSLDERRAWSAALVSHLGPFLRASPRGSLGFYWPFRAEFDPRPIVGDLLREGWRAALPVVIDRKGPMEFRAWTPDAPMESGVWDIPIPRERQIVVPDVVLAPLVGFDAANYRLGYGGGYFDRTLAALTPRPLAIGVGFELARLDSVRPQPFDLPMDYIVTEAGATS